MAGQAVRSKSRASAEPDLVTSHKKATRPARRKHPVASTREGKRNLTAYVTEEAFVQFKIRAARENTTVQDLLVEGVNAVFQARGLPRLA